MSDLFHEDVPLDYIQRMFDVMRRAHWHTFQILTKRAERLEALNPELSWPSNVWMGVSVESPAYTFRIADLIQVPAAIRFLSLEPLIAAVPRLSLRGIDWVIVGGESGPHARQMDAQWVRQIQRRCAEASVPFFFKQWGGTNKKAAGRLLDGTMWDEMPEPKKRVRKSSRFEASLAPQLLHPIPFVTQAAFGEEAKNSS